MIIDSWTFNLLSRDESPLFIMEWFGKVEQRCVFIEKSSSQSVQTIVTLFFLQFVSFSYGKKYPHSRVVVKRWGYHKWNKRFSGIKYETAYEDIVFL